ncbi:hypothetical protein ABT030_49615 [Streptomyces mirabilis]|uniref:hypothetical protein n=1 Tax=Streptomyces mirabilis TaxID=68239 RepID=UPI00332346D0
MARAGRRDAPIDREASPVHAFLDDLRQLRGERALKELRPRVHLTEGTISRRLNPETGLPDLGFVRAYVETYGGDFTHWEARFQEVAAASALRSDALRDSPTMAPATAPAPAADVPRQALPPETAANLPDSLARRLRVSLRRPRVVLTVAFLVLAGTAVTAWLADGEATPSASTTPEPLAQQCRTDWAPMPQASVYVMPCIRRDTNGVTITTKVKAIPKSGFPGEVTVWLWLMDQDPKMINKRTFQLTRNQSTLRRCRIHLDNGDQVKPCGPFTLAPPAKDGVYTTSSSARINDSVYPPGWDAPGFAGTQGGSLIWNGKEAG